MKRIIYLFAAVIIFYLLVKRPQNFNQSLQKSLEWFRSAWLSLVQGKT